MDATHEETLLVRGLTDREIEQSRRDFGRNVLEVPAGKRVWEQLKDVASEPMFLLLLAACFVYFVVGEYAEGVIMLVAMCVVAGISLYQENRTKSTLEVVNRLASPQVRVLRNQAQVIVASGELVVGDIMLLEEGDPVPAGGRLLKASDLSLDEPAQFREQPCIEVISYAMWASEPEPFDAMEKAIHKVYSLHSKDDKRVQARFIHEYPLAGSPLAMTHVFEVKGEIITACKGGVETIMEFAGLKAAQREAILREVRKLASNGYRVLGVASACHQDTHFPDEQKDFKWTFRGLIALYDPPKPGIQEVITAFYKAGIDVKVVSGDFTETTVAIAKQAGVKIKGKVVTGNEVLAADEPALKQLANERSVFARMYPEAKLKLINALKSNGETVAMTGDGVNMALRLRPPTLGWPWVKRAQK